MIYILRLIMHSQAKRCVVLVSVHFGFFNQDMSFARVTSEEYLVSPNVPLLWQRNKTVNG